MKLIDDKIIQLSDELNILKGRVADLFAMLGENKAIHTLFYAMVNLRIKWVELKIAVLEEINGK